MAVRICYVSHLGYKNSQESYVVVVVVAPMCLTGWALSRIAQNHLSLLRSSFSVSACSLVHICNDIEF